MTDFDHFEQNCAALRTEESRERQRELYQDTIELYQGQLCPRIEHDLWLMQRAMYYQSLYLQVIKRHICQRLEAKEYCLVQKAAIEGMRIDPHDSELNLYYVMSLCLQGNTALA